jgi:hypothetical protein
MDSPRGQLVHEIGYLRITWGRQIGGGSSDLDCVSLLQLVEAIFSIELCYL